MDAPLKHWHRSEFVRLILTDKDVIGSIYGCHKKDGHVCVGWLMDQDRRRLPSIALRLAMREGNVTISYLDSLSCKSDLYPSLYDMVKANYPNLKCEQQK